MNYNELLELLNGHEWTDIEFKEASIDVPKSAYETVSAFSNTHGGRLIFGVSETDDRFEIVGVENVDRVQNDFLSALKADNKVNHDILITADLITVQGKVVMVFSIPEASRQNKPIYLNGDIRRTFIRRGGGDQRCSMTEIERFLREAAGERWDGETFDFPSNQAFDKESLKWYRVLYNERNPGGDESLTDEEFLYQWGYLIRQSGKWLPTRASIILFGTPTVIHQLIPSPILDVQWIPAGFDEPLPELRWLDRIVYEENLITTWRSLVRKYMQYEPRPFSIDPHTLMRNDTPPAYRVFREAAINLLIHQDYADHSRKAVIKFFKDTTQFWNPGDVFGNYDDLLEPGEKEVRNPRIVSAFRRIALCEQAGTGMRMMKNQWNALGHNALEYNNDRSRKAFELCLKFKPKKATIEVAGEVTGEVASEVTGEVASEVTGEVEQVLRVLDKPMSRNELQQKLLLKGQANFRDRYLQPALKANLIEMTIPDKPQSSKQRYRITKAGIEFLKNMKGAS